jgi:hypothetical protein
MIKADKAKELYTKGSLFKANEKNMHESIIAALNTGGLSPTIIA